MIAPSTTTTSNHKTRQQQQKQIEATGKVAPSNLTPLIVPLVSSLEQLSMGIKQASIASLDTTKQFDAIITTANIVSLSW